MGKFKSIKPYVMQKLYALLFLFLTVTALEQSLIAQDIEGEVSLHIVEIMKNPSTAAADDANGEWFEIYNASGVEINLNGWQITDNGNDAHTISEDLMIPANGVVVLGNNGDMSLNGNYTPDYVYSGFTLANGEDEILLLAPNGSLIDEILYNDKFFPDANGSSVYFTGDNLIDNDDGDFWEIASVREAGYEGDTGDNGSPGTIGSEQTNLDGTVSAPELVLLDVQWEVWPNPATDLVKIVLPENGHLTILSVSGQTIQETALVANETTEVNTQNWVEGFYILQLSTTEGVITRKLLVQ